MVTRPSCIAIFSSSADTVEAAATMAARNAPRRRVVFMGVAPSIRPLGRRIELGGRPGTGLGSGELCNPERRVLARQIAGPADVRPAALEVLAAHRPVGVGVPDLFDRVGPQ